MLLGQLPRVPFQCEHLRGRRWELLIESREVLRRYLPWEASSDPPWPLHLVLRACYARDDPPGAAGHLVAT